MKFTSFEWDEHNIYHAIRHGISREEIEETIINADIIRKGRTSVYVAYGQTLDGRYVIVVFEYKGEGLVRPFSARPMTINEKKRVKRWIK
ncbi:MAG: BrnT family toxin [Elusimicrobia bacterium]|nr:BrnT family toxin [Elusimicrobiota bacterium]